jgi:membrane-anchored mycosin MYCP
MTRSRRPQWTLRGLNVGRVLRIFAVACVAVAACAAGPSPAMAAPKCADPGEILAPVPWSQQMLAPESVWPFTRGDGTIVAVLDSGVDANQPQLKGRVSAGFDAVTGSGSANTDCLGTGTQVAGVIAGRKVSSSGFTGWAPGVTILPIRVVADRTSDGLIADPHVLARGIKAAVDGGANVIAVSAISYSGTDELHSAVDNALAKGVIVIAAVGDQGDVNGANPTPYPAQYTGVLGVGAMGQTGERWSKSQHGQYVDLVAPGAEVVTLQRGQGMTVVDGTGVACGFVAATVALARARRGASARDYEIRQVVLGTTTPTPGGPGYGHGLVNPYAAVNNQVVKATPAPLPALASSTKTDTASAWARSRDLAIVGTGVALLAVFCVVLATATLPRGRRRFWRAGTAPTPRSSTEPDEPGPPLPLFEDRPAT